MNKQDLRVIKTKKNLFNKLLELLKTQSFNDITVTKLCEICEVNRSTFYTHFLNIDELFEVQMIEIMEKINKEFAIAYKQLDILGNDGLTSVYKHFLDYRNFYDILFSNKIPTKYLLIFIQQYMQYPKKIISNNIQSDIDYELYYTFCSSATIGLIIHWKNTGYKQSPSQMSVQTMKYFSGDF
jgi:AcrR family transcriptional regulator